MEFFVITGAIICIILAWLTFRPRKKKVYKTERRVCAKFKNGESANFYNVTSVKTVYDFNHKLLSLEVGQSGDEVILYVNCDEVIEVLTWTNQVEVRTAKV